MEDGWEFNDMNDEEGADYTPAGAFYGVTVSLAFEVVAIVVLLVFWRLVR